MKLWPALSVIFPFASLPTRIFGPCRSAMTATSRPSDRAASRTRRARCSWSPAAPCEKLSRTTSTPAASMRFSTSCVLLAGPSVATILVARCIRSPNESLRATALLEDRHRRQCLALEEFEEGAARGRDVADAIRDTELVDRGDRVATSGDGKGGRFGDRLRELSGSGGKGVELE